MKKYEISVSEFDGGNLRNAIPRAAHAVVGIHTSKKELVRTALNEYAAQIIA